MHKRPGRIVDQDDVRLAAFKAFQTVEDGLLTRLAAVNRFQKVQIALQPVSIQGQTGFNLAVGVAQLQLRASDID